MYDASSCDASQTEFVVAGEVVVVIQVVREVYLAQAATGVYLHPESL